MIFNCSFCRYEEAQFTLPPSIPPGVLMFKSPVAETPPNCQITVHSGPKEAIVAMATIDIKDLKELVRFRLTRFLFLFSTN